MGMRQATSRSAPVPGDISRCGCAMLSLNKIIGLSIDADIAPRLHDLSHAEKVEYLILDREDTLRRRLRATTDKGTDCAIAISRDRKLEDGAVLLLEEARAVVVRISEERWLTARPKDTPAALTLGYFAGNLHWRVRFDGDRLMIAMEGPNDFYLERLQPFVDDGMVELAADA